MPAQGIKDRQRNRKHRKEAKRDFTAETEQNVRPYMFLVQHEIGPA